MKFWYVESQKPTRDGHIWVLGIAEAGIKIIAVALHFNIPQTTAYQIIVSGIKGWHETTWDRVSKKTPKNLLHWRNISFISNQGGRDFFQQTRFAECLLGAVSGTRASAKTVWNTGSLHSKWRMLKILTLCPFYDRHCTPYERNLALMHARFGFEQDCNHFYCKKSD